MAASRFVSHYIHGAFKNYGKAPTASGYMGGGMSQDLYLHTSATASAVGFRASVIKATPTEDIADGHVA